MVGYIEPLEDPEPGEKVRFENRILGNAIPPGYIAAVEKGFIDACNSGTLIGHPVEVAHHIQSLIHRALSTPLLGQSSSGCAKIACQLLRGLRKDFSI